MKLRYSRKTIKNQPTFEKKILKKIPSFVELIEQAIEQLTEGKKA